MKQILEIKNPYLYQEVNGLGTQNILDEIYEIINLGNSSQISLNDMVKTISTTIGKEPIIEKVGMQKGDPKITCADITKAQKLLNYQPKVSFKEGIENYIKWCQ